MQLEINKSYVTENGSIVKITIEDKNTLQPFGGIIMGRGSAFFTSNGIYNLNNINSGFNIIKEMKLQFTKEYFINKFEAIPEKRWTIGEFKEIIETPESIDYRCCALGHCGMKDYSEIHSNQEAKALQAFFNTDTTGRASGIPVMRINDDQLGRYEGSTPKEKILNALRAL